MKTICAMALMILSAGVSSAGFAEDSNSVGPDLLLRVGGVSLVVPIAETSIRDFLRRSILCRPKDWVRDGLPHFGTMRDDWQGKPRRHQGIDIYGDGLTIRAAAAGRVSAVGERKLAGQFVKIDHGGGIATVYMHLTATNVDVGDHVASGAKIGSVNGLSGNGIEPQLHFELRVRGEAVDPIPLVREAYAGRADSADVLKMIDEAEANLPRWTAERGKDVEKFRQQAAQR